jgi:hypothetical protein
MSIKHFHPLETNTADIVRLALVKQLVLISLAPAVKLIPLSLTSDVKPDPHVDIWCQSIPPILTSAVKANDMF